MRVPRKELKYFLGPDYGQMKMPEFVEGLIEMGVDVNKGMTLSEIFPVVREAYKKRMEGK
jgi:hypothetical protein